MQAVLAQLPWYHHLALLDKLTSSAERRWYAFQAMQHHWSRNVLVMQIETKAHARSGQAVTNFDQSLPAPLSDLARESLKGWVSVGVPRILALTVLNAIGLSHWNDWPVTRFALSEEAKSFLTPEYGFNLAMNFAPHQDYKLDLENAKGKVAILAGDADEAFQTQELQGLVQGAGKDWPVQLLPGIGHIPLTLEPAALKAVVDMTMRLHYH